MSASLTDKLKKSKAFTSTTLALGISNVDTSISLSSASGWPTDTAVTMIVDRVDASGTLTPTKREVITGTISGNTMTTDSTRRGEDGTSAQSHSAAAVVELNPTAVDHNSLIDQILVGHNQDGTHKAFTESGIIGKTQFASLPGCRAYNSATISHASSGSPQALTFDSERFDTDTMHSTSANTGRITFTTAGVYSVSGHISFASNTTGQRALSIKLNGATVIADKNEIALTGGFAHDISVATIYKFAANDYVELTAFQNSGGALNMVATGNLSPEFAAQWMSP